MLGVSVYLQDLSLEYLRKCSELGVKSVFTSLQIPEEDYSDVNDKIKSLINCCNEYGLSLTPDVSPVTFEKLGLEANDFNSLKALGISKIRLDYGFDDVKHIKKLTDDFDILLNASVVDEQYISTLIKEKVDLTKLTMMHNYYPKEFTGLSNVSVLEKNRMFKKYGFKVQAFVCGDQLKRFPIYQGLITMESQRYMHPYVASVELLSQYLVDDIVIGDSMASMETLSQIHDFMENDIITIKAHFEPEYKYFYNDYYTVRKDLSEFSLRLNIPRIPDVPIGNNGIRFKGSITMDNMLYHRYSGETQIILNDLAADSRCNIIGFVHPQYLDLLKYISHNKKVRFISL